MTLPVIRAATADDIDQIDRLLRGLIAYLDKSRLYTPDRTALQRYGFGDRPLFHALLAERDTEPVGLCIYYPDFSTWLCRPGVFVLDLYIDPDCRGSGLGTRLLTETIRQAGQQWEAAYLKLSVDRLNQPALAFYRRLGFLEDTANQMLVLTGEAFDQIGAL